MLRPWHRLARSPARGSGDEVGEAAHDREAERRHRPLREPQRDGADIDRGLVVTALCSISAALIGLTAALMLALDRIFGLDRLFLGAGKG